MGVSDSIFNLHGHGRSVECELIFIDFYYYSFLKFFQIIQPSRYSLSRERWIWGFSLRIDASILFVHAEYGREGENPVLRNLFFRCATLMPTTFLPLFVFDGPWRPDVKRGKKINRTAHKLIPEMKQIIEAFSFEWRMPHRWFIL